MILVMLKSLFLIFLSVLGLLSSPKVVPKPIVHITPTMTATPTPTETPEPSPTDRGIHVPILLWHYISENPNKTDIARNGLSTSPAIFEQQLQVLKSNGFTPISF